MTSNRMDVEMHGLSRLVRASSVNQLREELLAQEPLLANGKFKALAILGAGPEGTRLADICRSLGIDVVGAYDGNARKRGMPFAGKSVHPSEALTRLRREIPIVIASHRVLGSYESLRALGYTIVPLAYLQVAAPDRFPPHVFYNGLLEDLFAHRERYEELAGMLADDRSRATLNAIIAYRLTLNPLYLRDVIDWNLYGTLRFGENEVYVDGGTYNGDSIQLFAEHVGGKYKTVYGFEPDSETFKVVSRRFSENPRVKLFNAGLYSRSGTLGFTADSSRAARIEADSAFKINVVSLDETIDDEVTFVKMNIEGAEIEALKGCRNMIGKYAPKLAISGYHRPAHLWQLPRLINELNGAYRLCLRQQDGGIIETVIYAVAA